MVAYASNQRRRRSIENVDFIFGDAAEVSQIFSQSFDYVTLMMCLHEMKYEARRRVVEGCLRVSNQVILLDYVSPFPKTMFGIAQNCIEYFAGKRHYTGFRDWQKRGGIDGFIEQENLRVKQRLSWQNGIVKMVTITGYENG
jgi:hypothetical protein